jgi:hypothetical protein
MEKRRRDVRAEARKVASHATKVRDRVRELTAQGLQLKAPKRGQIAGLVNEVLEGVTEGLERALPSRRSVLREVYGGLSEAVHTAALAGAGAARSVRERGKTVAGRMAPAAARRVRAANAELVGAVRKFAGKMSGEVKEELEGLARRARRTGRAVAKSAKGSLRAADGRLMELTSETSRAGVAAARSMVGDMAMAAGGVFEGLAEAAQPRGVAGRRGGRKGARKPRSKRGGRRRTSRRGSGGSKRSSAR